MTPTNDELKLQIIRRFTVTPDIVFDALTNPASMKIWWGDDAIIEIDLRVDGRWQITRQEDGIEYVAVGEYLVVERPSRLVYTFGMPQFSPNSDTISFAIAADEDGCIVTFEQNGEDIVKELSELAPGTVSQSEAGWQQGFDLMAAAWEKDEQMPRSQPKGYLAIPNNGQGPGVLVLHAWWGLNETIKGVCDRLSQEGFTAYAPDLYHGRIAQTIEEAKRLSGEAEAEPIKADIAAAVEFLSQQAAPASGKLGVIGFSFGAYFALELAVDMPERIHAVTLFYGTGEDDCAGSQAAYLGHFAEQDDYEPAEFVDQLEASLKAAGRPVTFHRYPDVGHWFFEPDRPDAYNQAAAELAWERTVAFLKQW